MVNCGIYGLIDSERDRVVYVGRGFDIAGRYRSPHTESHAEPEPCDPKVTEPTERRRLTGQNAAILARLRKGPATNAELAAISLKYTSRNSDLRRAGYPVEVISRDRKTGVVVYALISDPDVDPQGQGV